TWCPGIKKLYTENALQLLASNSLLKSVFPNCPFMAATLNLGPHSVCFEHRDHHNLAFGLCCVMVFGNFNYRRGGQVRLREAGVTWEVAPGDIFYIPSASITHSNLPIAPEENRYSFTLYSAGGLFSWTANG
ncbi:hypothetical protein K439DRAFT_1281358, partial [Ramaria rubella]